MQCTILFRTDWSGKIISAKFVNLESDVLRFFADTSYNCGMVRVLYDGEKYGNERSEVVALKILKKLV